MINIRNVQKYCCDDISLIENYTIALNSTERYDCHHRLETELNMSRDELIIKNLYLNRPASELIFLSQSQHAKIHMSGERNPMYRKNPLDYMTEVAKQQRSQKISIGNIGKETPLCVRLKISNTIKTSGILKGKNNPMYGKNAEDYMSSEAIIEKHKKQSKNATGNKNGRYHTKQMYKDGIYETVKYEDIDEYLYNGWIIKGRPHNKNQSIL